MSLESFYGGRMGASFVIVKHYDAINTNSAANKYKTVYYSLHPDSRLSDTNPYFLLVNGNFVQQTTSNFNNNNYTWKAVVLDGHSVKTKTSAGATGTKNVSTQAAEGMVQDFEKGGDTTDIVNYGEYVIIDTPSKDDPDNGKVFRRGMNYQYNASSNPYAGGEYIGQIVGPRGAAVELDIDTYNNVASKTGSVKRSFTEVNGSLVPGANTARSTFNDNIDYVWVNFRGADGSLERYFVGFKFPYLVTDITSKWRKPYYTPEDYTEGRIKSQSLIGNVIREDANFELFVKNEYQTSESCPDKDPTHGYTGHPFYRKWKVTIPKGIKGDTQTGLEIYPTLVTKGSTIYNSVTSSGSLYGPTYQASADMAIQISSYPNTKGKGYVELVGGGYAKLSDTRGLRMRYIQTKYDNKEAGESSYIDIGQYNTITNVSLSEDGWLTVFYSWDNPKTLENALRWIKYNEKTGEDGIKFSSDGTVTIIYNTKNSAGKNEQQTHPNLISWINSTTLTREGKFKVLYNNNSSQISPKTGTEGGKAVYSTDLTWPTQVSMTKQGVIKFMYNNNLLTDIYPVPWDEKEKGKVDRNEGSYSFIIPWIESVGMMEDGHFNFKFNNDLLYNILDGQWSDPQTYSPQLTWIKGINLDEDGHINFKFNNDLLCQFDSGYYIDKGALISTSDNGSISSNTFNLIDNTEVQYIGDTINIYDTQAPADWYDEGTRYAPQITWIDNVELKDDGNLDFTFNNNRFYNPDNPDWKDDQVTYSPQITWTDNVELQEDGHLEFTFNNNRFYDQFNPDWKSDEITYAPQITWITGMSMDTETGQFKFIFNNNKLCQYGSRYGLEGTTLISSSENCTIDDENALLSMLDNGLAIDGTDLIVEDTGIDPRWSEDGTTYMPYGRWIMKVTIDDDGTVHFWYSDGEEMTPAIDNMKIKYLHDLYVDTDGMEGAEPPDYSTEGVGDQKLRAIYNTIDPETGEHEFETIGRPINYIVETAVTEWDILSGQQAGHLLVYYSDPEYRAWLKVHYPDRVKEYKGNKDITKKDGWFDLGYVKGEPGGLHLIGNVAAASDLYDVGGNPIPPEQIGHIGLVDNDHAGWGMSVGDPASSYDIYIYDYVNEDWYSIGNFDSSLVEPEYVIATTNSPLVPPTLVKNHGFWIPTETIKFAV